MSDIRSKTIKMPWERIEDVLAAHLYATRAFSDELHELGEILIKKSYPKDGPTAELTVYYTEKGKK